MCSSPTPNLLAFASAFATNQGFYNPNLFRITTWLGIRETSCVRSINSAADSHARAGLLLLVFYVIGEAMINKVGIGQSVLFF
jgi:hypothetical protein